MKTENIIADSCFNIIKDLSPDIKLELISKISDSLRTSKVKTDDSWKSLFGAYVSDETAEEIITGLRNSRHDTNSFGTQFYRKDQLSQLSLITNRLKK